MFVDLEVLTPSQRTIYDGLAAGKTPAEIADQMQSSEAIVRANMTRIVTKGVGLPQPGVAPPKPAPDTVPVGQVLTPPRPIAQGGSENDRIAATIQDSAPALKAEELRAIADKVAGQTGRDVQPMILMGVTMQYVRLCGGRFSAHQVIEDVYGALRSFVTDRPLTEDDGGEALPLPSSDKERLEFLEKTNRELLKRIAELEGQSRGRQPAY